MNDEILIENKDKREELISKVEVLDKVKELILLPNTEFASVEMVAKYYEVSIKAVDNLVTRHRDELNNDGYGIKNRKNVLSVLNLQSEDLEILRGKTIVHINNSEVIVPNRGLRTFPKRAILRVGMLLRDSHVAKEVRTQLLNIVETAQEKLPEKNHKEY